MEKERLTRKMKTITEDADKAEKATVTLTNRVIKFGKDMQNFLDEMKKNGEEISEENARAGVEYCMAMNELGAVLKKLSATRLRFIVSSFSKFLEKGKKNLED